MEVYNIKPILIVKYLLVETREFRQEVLMPWLKFYLNQRRGNITLLSIKESVQE